VSATIEGTVLHERFSPWDGVLHGIELETFVGPQPPFYDAPIPMTICHHPSDAILDTCALGTANKAVSLLVACHASLCARCQVLIGGTVPPDALDRAYESVLARLDQTSAAIVRDAELESVVPPPLQPYIGRSFDEVSWRAVTPGYRQHRLFDSGGMRVRLTKANHRAPGRSLHTHTGSEWTLVLAGGFRDSTGQYGLGDVLSATSQTEHELIADPGTPCIALTVTEGSLLFRKLLPRIVGRIFGF